MVTLSPIEYEALQRRRASGFLKAVGASHLDKTEIKSESALHEKILEYCKAKRWAAIHGRMDKRSGITTGAPDFVIFATGKVLIVECKTKTGKQTTEQLGFQMMLEREGHEYHIVRSFYEFLKLVF